MSVIQRHHFCVLNMQIHNFIFFFHTKSCFSLSALCFFCMIFYFFQALLHVCTFAHVLFSLGGLKIWIIVVATWQEFVHTFLKPTCLPQPVFGHQSSKRTITSLTVTSMVNILDRHLFIRFIPGFSHTYISHRPKLHFANGVWL